MSFDYPPEVIAQVVHEANRAIQAVTGDPAPSLPWDDCPDEEKATAVRGVLEVARGTSSPEQLHESWVEGKLASGWVLGDVKDAAAQTHPCLVPYDELPADQRVKDAVLLAIVGAML